MGQHCLRTPLIASADEASPWTWTDPASAKNTDTMATATRCAEQDVIVGGV